MQYGSARPRCRVLLVFDWRQRLSPRTKKRSQQLAASIPQNTAIDIHPVVESMIRRQQIEYTAGRARLRIGGTEHDPFDPGMHNRTGAHWAGFERDIERGSGKAVIPQPGRRIAQRGNFRMGAGIVRADGTIPALADYLPVHDQHRTDRDLARLLRAAGKLDRVLHKQQVLCLDRFDICQPFAKDPYHPITATP